MTIQQEIYEKVFEILPVANAFLLQRGKAEIPTPTIVFSNRRAKTSAKAKAIIHRVGGVVVKISNAVLKFNTKIAELNRVDFLEKTVRHEIAHLMAYSLEDFGHGDIWKKCCMAIGIENPSRCHDFVLSGYVEYTCGCGKIFYETAKTSSRIESGLLTGKCCKCGGIIFKKPPMSIDSVA